MSDRKQLVAAVAGVVLLAANTGYAAQWVGETSTDFAEGSNWLAGVAPANDLTSATGQVVTLPATIGTYQPSLGAAWSVKGLEFAGSGWTLGGTGTMTIRAAGQPNGNGIVTTNTSGTNTISANVLIATADSAATGFDIATGGKLVLTGSIGRHNLTGGGAIIKSGGGTLEFNGTGSINLVVNAGRVNAAGGTGGLNVTNNNASLTLNNSGSVFDVQGVDINIGSFAMGAGTELTGSSGRFFRVNSTTNQTLSGLITGNVEMRYGANSSGRLTTIGHGDNTYTGPTRIVHTGLTLIVPKLANGGEVSSIGSSTSDAANLQIGGTLRYTGPAVTIDRAFTLTEHGGFQAEGTGALVITGDMTAGFAAYNPRSLRLTGTNTAANELRGIIRDGSNRVTSVVKDQTGKWILSGANTYTGGTTLTNGTLLVNNTTGSGTGTNFVNVAGLGVLGGTGTIGGNVTLADGATLTIIDATDPLQITGSLTIGATSVLDLASLTGLTESSYTLLSYGGSPVSFASVTGTPTGYELSSRSASGTHYIDLTVVPEPGMVGVFGAVTMLGLIARRRRA